MKVKLSILNEILLKCMSKDKIWKIIFLFPYWQAKKIEVWKWPNLSLCFSRLRRNPGYYLFE